ncbi:MAG: Holliday junction branch migration protein RuvA [Candidatus Taylorbacteria bacterium]|nr:Holliday junction branch migration protein RuvA [Candidatus Taylorbacteria bacterium]
MISYLKGKVIKTAEKSLVVDIGNIGYKVHVTPETASTAPENITLWTYTAVRENAIDIYGFKSTSELEIFELLISVSGIGPKTALGILSLASVEALQNAIISGETSHLTKVSGIGKKNAEKIVLELKGKVLTHEGSKERIALEAKDADVVEALKALGYSPGDARDALKEIPKEITGTNSRIKEALKLLGK